MINRFISTGAKLVQSMASQPFTGSSVIKTARALLTTARHTLTVFGLSAVAMLALLYTRPEMGHRVSALINPQPAPQVAAPAITAAMLISQPVQAVPTAHDSGGEAKLPANS